MDDYRQAVCVHLHDQRLTVTDDVFTHGTGSQWNIGNSPEYSLFLPPDLQKAIAQLLGLRPRDIDEVGIRRGYAEYPCDGPGLQRLEVRIVSDRIIDLRLRLAVEEDKIEWTEEWTYSGSFTVVWAEAPQ